MITSGSGGNSKSHITTPEIIDIARVINDFAVFKYNFVAECSPSNLFILILDIDHFRVMRFFKIVYILLPNKRRIDIVANKINSKKVFVRLL